MKTTKLYLDILIKKINKANLSDVGATLAYYLLLSIFPFLIFLLNVTALIASGYENEIMNIIKILPSDVQPILSSVIGSLLSSSSGVLLSFSIILALWSGSNGMNQVFNKIKEAFDSNTQYGIIGEKLIGLALTASLGLVLIFLLTSNVFGEVILSLINRFINDISFIKKIWSLFSTILPLIIMILVFSCMYKIGSIKKGEKTTSVSWLYSIIGAAFTSLLWIAFTFAFSYYVNNFGNYDKTYGSIGGIIILMLWLFVSSITMVLGAYVSASLDELKTLKGKEKTVFGTARKINDR